MFILAFALSVLWSHCQRFSVIGSGRHVTTTYHRWNNIKAAAAILLITALETERRRAKKISTSKSNMSETGIFTAPVAGVYYLTFFYHSVGHPWLTLFKNGEMIVKSSAHPPPPDGANNGGNAVVLDLQQGDQVYVSLQANRSIWAGDDHTSFSGFLLS
uniref:C1q domain-containing protein n=1 Tax=Sparus aurata TaxID=8175 RepID=A0A671VTS8_SPAAU